jgi:pimeloyl-ACP methyl ester carboxylesterase
MPTLTANDIELYYERRGSGEPLLLIMGMSGNTVHWGEPFLSELERSFEVIAYDHRGIGQSAAHWDPFTIQQLASDAIAVLDALGLDSAHVCGISMGGMVAQEIALLAPGRVRTLTLGCTSCGGPEAAFGTPQDMQLLGESLASGDRDRALKTGFEMNVSAAYAADPAHWELFLERATTHPAPVTFISLQMQAIAGHDTSGRLGDITAPTLVVHGTDDRMLPASNAEVIARLIPGARLELFDRVGHLFFWERPAESAALIAEHAGLAAAAQ